MKKLEKQVAEEVESLLKKFAENTRIKDFEKSVDQFEELVKRGVIRKRGNNLLSASDAHVKNQVWFNTGSH